MSVKVPRIMEETLAVIRCLQDHPRGITTPLPVIVPRMPWDQIELRLRQLAKLSVAHHVPSTDRWYLSREYVLRQMHLAWWRACAEEFYYGGTPG